MFFVVTFNSKYNSISQNGDVSHVPIVRQSLRRVLELSKQTYQKEVKDEPATTSKAASDDEDDDDDDEDDDDDDDDEEEDEDEEEQDGENVDGNITDRSEDDEDEEEEDDDDSPNPDKLEKPTKSRLPTPLDLRLKVTSNKHLYAVIMIQSD